MIEAPPLISIKRTRRRPTEAQIAAFQGVPTGFVVDALYNRGALSSAIVPLAGRERQPTIAGPALTAECTPGDVLGTFAALGSLVPGDILLTAFGGYQGCAVAGDRLAGMMKNCGAIGFVTDGPMRDYPGVIATGLPVWCSGITPASPQMTGPGMVGFPIQIGGQEVETGDMVIADQDGVVVVPFERIDEALEGLERVKTAEAEADAKVAAGLRIPPWVEAILAGDQTVTKD
ncbi:RraA family protein [Acuticoccus yangtzensis]|uniref:RraA family protein n=1 Tax=Acuticoccus yangtzensis TaxID=1443441 RepID=UPI00094977AD|nr:aldolase [Acuticoccus yangtzensis]